MPRLRKIQITKMSSPTIPSNRSMSIGIKQIITSVVLLVSNLLLGLVWYSIPEHPIGALLAILSGIAWTLFVLFAEHKPVYYAISALSVISLIFGLGLNQWTLVGTALGLIVTAMALRDGFTGYEDHLKISLRAMFGRSVRMYLTALAVVFSFAYFGIASTSEDTTALLLPEEIFNIGVRVAEKPLQTIVPGISMENTVDEAIALFLREQLKQSGVVAPNDIPPIGQIKQMIPSQRKELIRTINKELGVNIDVNTPGSAKLSTVLYGLSTDKLNDYVLQFSSYVPLLMGVGFFLSLKAISYFYYYVIVVMAALCIKLLVKSGVCVINTVDAKKETIV